MKSEAVEPYVRAALALQGYRCSDEQQIARVVLQFERIADIAQVVLEHPLDLHLEPATVYRP